MDKPNAIYNGRINPHVVYEVSRPISKGELDALVIND